MADIVSGPAARLARVCSLMDERGYDGMVVRDEANLRWLTGARGVFDFTGELPHCAFITRDAAFLHTDSRYFNSFAEHMPADHPWAIDMDGFDIPRWTAERARDARCRTIAVEDTMELAFYRGLTRSLEDVSVACSIAEMHADLRRMRAVKDEEEIALMRAAQAITDAAFAHMLTFIKPGLTEKEIKQELERYMFAQGADGLAFDTIVASGPNTANPHAIPSDRVVEKGDFVLMDYGARLGDYDSDMTRTVVLGEPTPEQRKIYDLVQRTHEECARAIHGGVDGKDVHELSVKIISDAGYGDYYGHGLGHGVGIDIHEMPNFGRRSNTVEAGAVITVEPGVYLPGVGGVRLEDYGLVTEKGFEPFTTSPHELQVIAC
ncbi:MULTISPECIES: Xaa-Pro peptidase family protein [Collinsella]|uniref:M24 family metallopeptidase n=1 Tax=Collinsella TaxID=102106 RepID=UPI000B394E71|nr:MULTISPECIES: Xaa-Pro peptidase family protein [Collinsella]MBM6941712.1 aminopeptidase P family protein [Collinsella intestinalis]OUO65253.1 peptidase M24 family protein [Collinsella sp. An268]